MAFFSILRSSPMAVPAAASSSRPPPPFSCISSHAAAVLRITSSKRRASSRAATSLSVRCEQSANQGGGGGGGADVWVGRLAMVSVTAAITAELSTGKGLLENLGVATPAPVPALVVTALVVGLVVLFISQSGSRD